LLGKPSANAEGKLTNAWVLLAEPSTVLQAGSWVSKDGKAEAYQYDSMGRRTKTYTLDPDVPTYPVATSETVYGRGWEELQRLDGANTANTTTTDLLSLQSGLVPRRLASYSSGSASATRASYYQLDALGSGRAVTGAAGAVQGDFASFGDFGTRLSTTDQPLTPSYTGYEHDAYTGLEYAKNRYYDPQTASFISSDPYPVDPSDLLSMNLYNYVQGNPVNSTDPLGWFNWGTLTTEDGDTIWSVANEWGTTAANIILLNPDVKLFSNENGLFMIKGQRILFPSCASAKCMEIIEKYQNSIKGWSPSTCGEKKSLTNSQDYVLKNISDATGICG
jgi:RHS repeat-associated protein